MVNATEPWLLRGGNWNNTTNAGVFASGIDYGHANNAYSFRQVL